MSVNQTFAFNSDKLNKLGRYYSTIDFNFNPNYSKFNYQNNHLAPVGEFQISDKNIKLNLEQINKLKFYTENLLCATKQSVYEIKISDYQFTVNFNEIDRIYETLLNIIEILEKKYRLNLLL